MDSRILSVTENLMRRTYNLPDSYVSTKCNISKKDVTMEMTNEMFLLKGSFPRSYIEELVEYEGYDTSSTSETTSDEDDIEEQSVEEEPELEVVEEAPAPKKAKKSLKKK